MEEKFYKCPICQMKSYNSNDIKFKYCGNCHKFENINIGDIIIPPGYEEKDGYKVIKKLNNDRGHNRLIISWLKSPLICIRVKIENLTKWIIKK